MTDITNPPPSKKATTKNAVKPATKLAPSSDNIPNYIFTGFNEYKYLITGRVAESAYHSCVINVYPILDVSVLNDQGLSSRIVAVRKRELNKDRPELCIQDDTDVLQCLSFDSIKGCVGHPKESDKREFVAAVKNLDDIPRIWNYAVAAFASDRKKPKPIYVFFRRSVTSEESYENKWALTAYQVPYTGTWTCKSGDKEISQNVTDEKYFYRTLGEVVEHFKKQFTNEVLDDVLTGYVDKFNKKEQERRDAITERMNKLLALQNAYVPVTPAPTVDDWWHGLTDTEKEAIRAKKMAKTAKRAAK